MSVYHKLQAFVRTHRTCGMLRSLAESPTTTGYLLWIDCSCGATFERWVMSHNEDESLLRSALLDLKEVVSL
jgi:hypothetical protein